jgi:hypothetical protein
MIQNYEPLPSVWSGSFHIFGVTVKCHVLSDGQRIIEADSLKALLKAMSMPARAADDETSDLYAFAEWRSGR